MTFHVLFSNNVKIFLWNTNEDSVVVHSLKYLITCYAYPIEMKMFSSFSYKVKVVCEMENHVVSWTAKDKKNTTLENYDGTKCMTAKMHIFAHEGNIKMTSTHYYVWVLFEYDSSLNFHEFMTRFSILLCLSCIF